jgi:DNA-binding NarL/FixJ family response regulator
VPEVRVIGLSVREDDEVALAMREAGSVAQLPKGGDIEALFAAVRSGRVGR